MQRQNKKRKRSTPQFLALGCLAGFIGFQLIYTLPALTRLKTTDHVTTLDIDRFFMNISLEKLEKDMEQELGDLGEMVRAEMKSLSNLTLEKIEAEFEEEIHLIQEELESLLHEPHSSNTKEGKALASRSPDNASVPEHTNTVAVRKEATTGAMLETIIGSKDEAIAKISERISAKGGAFSLLPPEERPIVGEFIPPEALMDSATTWITAPTDKLPSTPYLPLAKASPAVWASGEDAANVPLPGKAVQKRTHEVATALRRSGHEKLARMFTKCFPNTLETTVQMMQDGRAYVITGDIDLMWLRDSTAQVHPYITAGPDLAKDITVVAVVEGTLRMQAFFIRYGPYGSSFRPTFRPNPPSDDGMTPFHMSKARNVHVSMHNFELDSLLYPIWLAHQWWKVSGRTAIFTQRQWHESIWLALDVLKREQRHFLNMAEPNDCKSPPDGSCYRYLELHGNEHEGQKVGYTGMVWSSHRPSDDKQQYGYLVPSNCFAVVVLAQLAEIANDVLHDMDMAQRATQLRRDILKGIKEYGIVTSKEGNPVFAYEVDGLGKSNQMDDANVPSLLSLPYLGFDGQNLYSQDVEQALGTNLGELLDNTRALVMSNENRYFWEGRYARGIGSPHTPGGNIWHMSLSMQGLTIGNEKYEKEQAVELCTVFQTFARTDAGTDLTHESFRPDNPQSFTRTWFAWSNSLFGELVLKHFDWLTDESTVCNTTVALPPMKRETRESRPKPRRRMETGESRIAIARPPGH